jgi:hypothetical protein
MSQAPYNTAHRVFGIMDNCSVHRGQQAVDRFRTKWPNAILVHTPIHLSSLNQIEILLDRSQKGSQPQRRLFFARTPTAAAGFPATLRTHRRAFPVDFHPQKSPRRSGQNRPQIPRARSLTGHFRIRHRNSEP